MADLCNSIFGSTDDDSVQPWTVCNGRKAGHQLEEDRDKSEYDCGCSRPGAVFDTTSAAGCTGRYDDIHGKGCRTGQYDHVGNDTGGY